MKEKYHITVLKGKIENIFLYELLDSIRYKRIFVFASSRNIYIYTIKYLIDISEEWHPLPFPPSHVQVPPASFWWTLPK